MSHPGIGWFSYMKFKILSFYPASSQGTKFSETQQQNCWKILSLGTSLSSLRRRTTKQTWMCPVSRIQKEVKPCFKASLLIAGIELSQGPAWRGEQLHEEAHGTCITKLGVPWEIYAYKMRTGLKSLKIIDGCTETATFTSEYFEMGDLPQETPSCRL